MTFRPDRPFNESPRLPPSIEVETRPVLKACIEARAALAELKATGDLIPNQAVLINTIPMLEAQASSAIENIVTTTDRLFRFAGSASPAQADPATKEALRYRTALHDGFRDLARRPVTTATAVRICRTLRGVDTDIRATPGTALANEATGEVIYTHRTARHGCAICWPTGSATCTGMRRPTLWSAWPWRITSSRPYTHSPTATAAPAACSTCCSWSSRSC